MDMTDQLSHVRLGQPPDEPLIRSFDEFKNRRAQELAEERLFVWTDGTEPVGYVTMARDGFIGHPYVEFLCVHPDYRRRGIASTLLLHCETQHAGRRLFISTESNNATMLALLEARGYVGAGSVSGANRDGSDEVFFFRDLA